LYGRELNSGYYHIIGQRLNSEGIMKFALHLIAVLAFAASQCHATPVFKVSKGDDAFYLAGTIHLLAPEDLPLPAAFDIAYANSDMVVLETDLSHAETPAFRAFIAKTWLNPNGHIKTLVDDATYTRLESFAKARGIDIETLGKLKVAPMASQLLIVELHRLGNTEDGVDQRFAVRAKTDNKHIMYLESPESQVEVLANIAQGQEDKYLRFTLDDFDQLQESFSAMRSQWRTWQPDALNRESLKPMRSAFPDMYQALVVDRNMRWMPKLRALIGNDRKEFVLVGALHMVGEHSILKQLEERGFTIEQLTD